jgi:hypothetical protein
MDAQISARPGPPSRGVIESMISENGVLAGMVKRGVGVSIDPGQSTSFSVRDMITRLPALKTQVNCTHCSTGRKI